MIREKEVGRKQSKRKSLVSRVIVAYQRVTMYQVSSVYLRLAPARLIAGITSHRAGSTTRFLYDLAWPWKTGRMLRDRGTRPTEKERSGWTSHEQPMKGSRSNIRPGHLLRVCRGNQSNLEWQFFDPLSSSISRYMEIHVSQRHRCCASCE